MKLAEVIEALEQFGFGEGYVRQALAAGDSAFNAFEGLKMLLQYRWREMCQELSAERQKELRPIYDKLQGLVMKSRMTPADKERQERASSARIADRLQDHLEVSRRRNMREFTRMVRDGLRKDKREGKLDAAGEARARALGFFDADEEI